MKREIKFRGQRADNIEWVTGNLLKTSVDKKPDPEFTDGIQVYENGIFKSVHAVLPETVGQYTGKKTKFEEEVYEDDILRSDTGKFWVVKWSSLSDGWVCFPYVLEIIDDEKIWSIDSDRYPLGHSLSGLLTYKYKVIGNIHSNPELLK